MIFPEQLYQLTGKDRTGALTQAYFRKSEISAATAIQTAEYTIPGDSNLIVSNLSIFGDGGGAQTVDQLSFYLNDPAGTTSYMISVSRPGIGIASLIWTGTLWIPGSWRLFSEAQYSAAALANLTSAAVFGILIPEGNFLGVA